MARVMVRLLDEAENRYDYFIGETADCPPIPRVGDHVTYHLGTGEVQAVVHVYEDGIQPDAYRIAIKLKMLK
jgi:hypothetical protein